MKKTDRDKSMKQIDAINTIVAFARTVHLKRALSSVESDPELNFWRVVHGNCTDIAAVEWCKLFGSDREQTHWKNVVPNEGHSKFRKGLFEATGMEEPAWLKYREEIVFFRNTLAAHMDIWVNRAKQYPVYDAALTAAYYYYDWISENAIDSGLLVQHEIRSYCRDFEAHSKSVAIAAFKSTSEIRDLNPDDYKIHR